ncbi:MAG: hypothetical protein MZU84_02300 [Sphingobacterium sp.]|nr:hypothetical protein [Sphingobacterium sp.]
MGWNQLVVDGLGRGWKRQAISVYGSDLYVAGDFSAIQGVNAKSIAKWNGSTWSAVGSGTDGMVHSLLLVNGSVYAGGHFSCSGGIRANSIAKWDGTNWSGLSHANGQE